MKVAISSGHGLYVRGASGHPVPPQLDEVDEARRVVDRVAHYLEGAAEVVVFHDNTSHSQSENLDTIVDWHNQQTRDYDVSVHFNCYDGSAHGVEVLWVTQEALAARMSEAIALAGGFTNRGAKERTDLAFLNGTEEPAILIETCFCDHTGDCSSYQAHFDNICSAIAEILAGQPVSELPEPSPPERPEDAEPLFYARGLASWFGGEDSGVAEDEGLAFIYDIQEAPHLFVPNPPPNVGLARSLDAERVFYIACRWDYQVTPKGMLADQRYKAKVSARGKSFYAFPADWGPAGPESDHDTGRVADLSPALMDALGIETDSDEVEVIYPA
jgi:N-acetylmuramoyl-L-alanine amidase